MAEADVKFVFFDAGETLLRPEPSFPELAAQVLHSRGHRSVTATDVIDAGRATAHHFRKAADEKRVFSASAEDSKAFWTTLYTEMLEHLAIDDDGAPHDLVRTFSDPASYGLFSDAVPCLNQLKTMGLRLGIISNFEGWLLDVLAQLGVREMFDVVAVSGPLNVEKPDPKIFEWAVAEAGVSSAECVHVGDQPHFDADAAVACGLRAVLLDRYGRWEDSADYPRVASLDDLPGLLA